MTTTRHARLWPSQGRPVPLPRAPCDKKALEESHDTEVIPGLICVADSASFARSHFVISVQNWFRQSGAPKGRGFLAAGQTDRELLPSSVHETQTTGCPPPALPTLLVAQRRMHAGYL